MEEAELSRQQHGNKILVAEQKTVSLRVSARGELTDFLERENKDCAYSNKVISGIIGKLWNYKEEGVELSPSLIYTDDIVAFSKKLPGFSKLSLGKCDATEDAAKRILKDCAPLTGESSLIFVERQGEGEILSYGVFSFLRSPTAISIDEMLRLDSDQFAVLIKKSSPTTLQVLGSNGNSVSILMSTVREDDTSESEIENFISNVTSGIDGECDDFKKYLKKLFLRELTNCHGTILICAEGHEHPEIPCIADKIALEEAIDFREIFEEFRKVEDAESLLNLQRAEDLFRGFLSCDGMIAFSPKGAIISYRVFYKPEKGDAETSVVGGARRRAFSGITSMKLNELKSALFRSQDGSTEYKEIANGE